MAEQKEEKSKLPLTGMLALLLAVVSSWIIYEVPLKTSRPIEKEAEKTAYVTVDRVQSRLWQDPFEAVSTHEMKEKTSSSGGEPKTASHHDFRSLIETIKVTGAPTTFRMVPVFVDGGPYANGVESRLKDRYAVVSALGAAGYIPESGEYIRYFRWERKSGVPLTVPVEWFRPESTASGEVEKPHLLVLWIKDQDFAPHPLQALGELVDHLSVTAGKTAAGYRVLGPRSSGSLAAMLSELQAKDSDVTALKGTMFYSSWATAANAFLFTDAQQQAEGSGVEAAFAARGLVLIRTIDTDAALAEQLVEELTRRDVNLCIPPSVPVDCQPPHVALISEWDTLYGRALPRTFIAVAENMAKSGDGRVGKLLDQDLHRLRADNWPSWVHRYSYLAGLDGELPPKGDGKEGAGTQVKGKASDKIAGVPSGSEEVPTGRGQLDYLRRLAEMLKREGTEFRAVGVLGSDVYDKLMILQALRADFPHAVFFTTDLDTRLLHSAQGAWARNLIVASHFGLTLHPELQSPIPPFRDSYQTALFYSTLRAVDHLLPGVKSGEVRTRVSQATFSIAGKPRLYEIGRHGAVDLSVDEPGEERQIHPPRPDLNPATGMLSLPNADTIGLSVLALAVALLCALLLNSELLNLLCAPSYRVIVVSPLLFGVVLAGVCWWALRDGPEGEPLSVMQGVSVWPTTFIRLLAGALCGLFLYYSWMRLRANDRALTGRFEFLPSKAAGKMSRSPLSLHYWMPHADGSAMAEDLWHEYQTLGRWTHRLSRILPQTLCYLLLGWCLMQLFGRPSLPCRGSACFDINQFVLRLSVVGMTVLMFYVVDATRLCRRLIKIMIATNIQWPAALLTKEAARHATDTTLLNEWLGIELIAQRTGIISFMLYYPFIILFLMGVARHTYFDRWDFPVSLMVLFGLNAAYALGNAVYLRRSAEEAKRTAIEQLRVKATGLPAESETATQIERMVALIEHNQDGAFLPFTQHPLFGAIVLPTGGTGVLLLIEYLATIF